MILNFFFISILYTNLAFKSNQFLSRSSIISVDYRIILLNCGSPSVQVNGLYNSKFRVLVVNVSHVHFIGSKNIVMCNISKET